MNKIAIMTDSNSGITQKEAERLGIRVLPMPFFINDELFYEDITLTQEEFYQRLAEDADISTSQPSPADVMELWEELLEEYDEVIHIPMSSGLSSSCETAIMLAKEFDGRVHVVDNQRISVTQRQSVMDAIAMRDKGMSADEIVDVLMREKLEASIYITVDTLKYLKKGGRITPAAAALGTLLKIKPVLIILGEKLDACAKSRTVKQAKSVMLTAIQKELETRLHDGECRRCHLAIAHTNNEEAALEFKKEVAERYPYADVIMAPLSLSIACHIGPGSLAVTATRKMDEEYEEDHGAV